MKIQASQLCVQFMCRNARSTYRNRDNRFCSSSHSVVTKEVADIDACEVVDADVQVLGLLPRV